ncbi:hypothetical protein F5Y15DRAFT_370594 [Xylariaceae sp. FL0016]|nr:hypothetical protein F5Y15DRAFT_370594 [Xylariaceae sp. FL0016]
MADPALHMFPIMKLPHELRIAVAQQCSFTTLKHLVATCHDLYAAGAPRARSSIWMIVRKDDFGAIIKKCLDCPLMMNHVRELRLEVEGLEKDIINTNGKFGVFLSGMRQLSQLYVATLGPRGSWLEKDLLRSRPALNSLTTFYPCVSFDPQRSLPRLFARAVFDYSIFPNLRAIHFTEETLYTIDKGQDRRNRNGTYFWYDMNPMMNIKHMTFRMNGWSDDSE